MSTGGHGRYMKGIWSIMGDIWKDAWCIAFVHPTSMLFHVSYHMSLPYVRNVSVISTQYAPLYVFHALLSLNLPVLLSPLGANLGEQLLHCTFGLSLSHAFLQLKHMYSFKFQV